MVDDTTSIRTRPAYTFFLRSQFGRELWLPFLLLAVMVNYLIAISPRYRVDGHARLLLFDALPLFALPFLGADTRFDSRGAIRLFTTPRDGIWALFLAYGLARLSVGLAVGVGLGGLSWLVGHDTLTPVQGLRLVLGLASLGIYLSALGSIAGILTEGRLSIATTFTLLVLGGLAVIKAGDHGALEYLVCPASLGTLESIERVLRVHPWHVLAGPAASLIYWAVAWRLFRWRCGR